MPRGPRHRPGEPVVSAPEGDSGMKTRHVGSVVAALTLTVGAAGCASTVQRPADLTQLGVSEAAQLIREKKVTSAELTQAFLARAEANPDLNAYITLDRTGALNAARQADADLAAGKTKGPLHGVPLAVKDNVHVAGMPNTAGTPALRNFIPREHAPTAQKLIDAGAIVLGKTACTSWPSGSPATTRRSTPRSPSAHATRTIARALRAAAPAARARPLGAGWRRVGSGVTPAAPCAFPRR